MAKISETDVLKLAKLSKLSLTEEQVKKFQAEIGAIVDYVEQLSSVDVSGLKPTNQVTGLVSVMREDEELVITPTEELLKNLPARDENLIKVKRVL